MQLKWTPAIVGKELALFDRLVARSEAFLSKFAPDWLEAAKELRAEYEKCGDQLSNSIAIDPGLGEAAVKFQEVGASVAPRLKNELDALGMLRMILDMDEKS